MQILTLILCTLVLVATGLPLIKSAAWWIRIFDFPRIQIAALTFLAIILAYLFLDFKWEYKLPLLLILAVSLVYQIQFVVVYTPLYKTQAKNSNKPAAENSFTLLVSNNNRYLEFEFCKMGNRAGNNYSCIVFCI